MTKLIATFRIVTPMFLGGANPSEQAELRVPSIKGALRFWWRALMWGKVTDIADLRRKEAELFGSSDVGQSKVLLRLEKYFTSTQKVTEAWPQGEWKRYTGYGIRDKGEHCFPPANDWKLHISMAPDLGDGAESFLNALKLFGLAGGLGSRSRKGWGSTTLLSLEGASWQCPSSQEEWNNFMQTLLGGKQHITAPYTAVTNATAWNSAAPETDAAKAQAWLGSLYQKHVTATDPKADRAQFGLPRIFKGTPPRRECHERRASPLFLHIHQCPGGKALPCALWLPADFLEKTKAIPGNGESALQFVESLNAAPASSR